MQLQPKHINVTFYSLVPLAELVAQQHRSMHAMSHQQVVTAAATAMYSYASCRQQLLTSSCILIQVAIATGSCVDRPAHAAVHSKV